MKKLFPLLLAFVMSVPCLAQQMRPGLVKDEGGYTNIRKGPGTQYEVVDQIPDGMFINFVKGNNGWCKVYTNYTDDTPQDLIGYIAASKIVVPPRKGPTKVVAYVKDEGGNTNIRKGPGTNYAIVGKVRDGSYVLVSGDYGECWLKVYTQKGDLRGYISASKLEPLESPGF